MHIHLYFTHLITEGISNFLSNNHKSCPFSQCNPCVKSQRIKIRVLGNPQNQKVIQR